jgi:hypothetical protein
MHIGNIAALTYRTSTSTIVGNLIYILILHCEEFVRN